MSETDLISRQAALDALNQIKIYRPLDSDRWVISDCLNKIVNLPSAQPENIRCKGCKHWRINYYQDVETCFEHRNVDGTEQATSPEDYCSWAERREDEA